MSSPDYNEMTLDELRPHLAATLPQDAGFDGWSDKALKAAAKRLKVKIAIARLAFPGGAMDMIDAWFANVDTAMLAGLPPETLKGMKIRERITALVEARLTCLAPHREALRRAQAILALPQHATHTTQLGWRAAGTMWRAAGDVATDYNHYTKRGILAAVYAATLLVFVDDESENWADTRAFLARRIEGIMRFEKTKSRFISGGERRFSLARFLGRLRYPAA